MRASWRWSGLCGDHTPPNVDVLPLKRKELRESSLVSPRAPLLVTSILYCLVYLALWYLA